ncbi:hypothetical protein EJB05_27309, partial [Eragrostis curvula]
MSATDRISDLPDDLLLHVMFFLTLQEAVQTCLLSRRWKNVWASLMWLHFDATKFSSMKAFKKFVDNLLQYRNSLPAPVPLDAFWISAVCNNSNDSLDYSDIHPWIRHALDSNAWALGIPKHRGPKPLSIEGYLFPFTSVHLKLLGLCHFKVDDCFVENLSSCCPVLEDLELKSCAIHITLFYSTSLNSLTITSTEEDRDFPEEFGSLSNATSVELLSASVFEDVVPKVLQRDLSRCVIFSRLKRLHLGEWFLSRGCYPLIYLLKRSPEVQKLTLQLDKASYTILSLICFFFPQFASGLNLIFRFNYQSGADDYNNRAAFPNADAEIDPHEEAHSTFSCEKLRKIRIHCPPSDERAQIVVRILSAHLSPLPSIKIKPIPSKLVG